MKTLFFSLILSVVSLLTIDAQSIANDSIKYANLLSKTLLIFDSVKTVDEIKVVNNSFQRLVVAYPNQWLPLYYETLCYINQAYQSQESSLYLQEAEKRLTQLDKMMQADQSEVQNLWGYYYMCIVSKDPQTAGREYFQTVISRFERAIQLNDKNPRPIILLAFFEQNLPSFLQSKRDPIEQKQKAQTLFDNEQRNINSPYWGKSFLNQIKNK